MSVSGLSQLIEASAESSNAVTHACTDGIGPSVHVEKETAATTQPPSWGLYSGAGTSPSGQTSTASSAQTHAKCVTRNFMLGRSAAGLSGADGRTRKRSTGCGHKTGYVSPTLRVIYRTRHWGLRASNLKHQPVCQRSACANRSELWRSAIAKPAALPCAWTALCHSAAHDNDKATLRSIKHRVC